jgi:hypothetical protein
VRTIPGVRVRAATLAVVALLAAGCSDSGGDPPAPAASTTTTLAAPLAELPVPRTEVAAAVLGGRIVVAGGLTLDWAASDRVDLYDPSANRWEPAPALPLGLHHSGMAALGDRVYVAGGYTNGAGQEWVSQSRVVSLGAGDRAWREEPALAGTRGGLALAAAGGRLVAVGGTDNLGRFLVRTEVFTPGQRAWSAGPDMAEPRDHLAAAGAGGRVYAIAGRLGGLDTNKATVESWDPSDSGRGWRPEPRLNDTRGGTSAAEAGGRPCVAGGEQPAGTIASVECLADGRWSRVAQLRTPRHGLGVAGVGDRLHVIAGGPEPGLFVSGAHEAFTIAR